MILKKHELPKYQNNYLKKKNPLASHIHKFPKFPKSFFKKFTNFYNSKNKIYILKNPRATQIPKKNKHSQTSKISKKHF